MEAWRRPRSPRCCRRAPRSIATAVADDRIAVTIEQGGTIEVRTFDLKTLRPTGRLRFATEP